MDMAAAQNNVIDYIKSKLQFSSPSASVSEAGASARQNEKDEKCFADLNSFSSRHSLLPRKNVNYHFLPLLKAFHFDA
jgi:hypothetical protein